MSKDLGVTYEHSFGVECLINEALSDVAFQVLIFQRLPDCVPGNAIGF